jgi:hypothetical protein
MTALLRCSCLLAVALFVAGCGQKPTYTMSGTVSYKGKPVTGGLIFFFDAQGKSYPGSLNADGTYRTPGLEPGDYTVTVDNQNLKYMNPGDASKEMIEKFGGGAGGGQQGGGGAGGPEAQKWMEKMKGKQPNTGKDMPIPEKYKDAKTSGIKVKVEPGELEQQKDFTLTD